MILLPALAVSVPGLAIGILLVFHLISRSKTRRHVYMALVRVTKGLTATF